MEDACEKAFLLADQALAAEANSPTPSVETLEQEVLPLLRQLGDPRYPYAICWETAERQGYLNTAIAMIEMATRVLRNRRDQKALHVHPTSRNGNERDPAMTDQRCVDANHSPPAASRMSSHDSTSGAIKRKESELDPFREGRKLAIERTIVSDTSLLPKLEDLVGLVEAKQALREALFDPLTYPEWFSSSDLKPWRCVLLYGPPGTGKTQLSQSIAREINSRFYQVSSSDLISTWSGQSEKLIRELFDDALSYTGTSVIFVDEIDSLCRIRSTAEDESSRRVKTELLVQLQRLHDSKSSILLVCATNCPWDLDSAFLRRFEKRIFVGLPELDSRVQLLQKFLSKTKTASDLNWDEIAEATEGYSGDDLKRLAREIAFLQFRKYKESHAASQPDSGCATASQAERIPVSAADFHEVLQSFSPSVSRISLQRYDDYKSS